MSSASTFKKLIAEISPMAFSISLNLYLLNKFNFVVGDGRSMEPTLENNTVFFVNKTTYRKSKLRRGDVIIATSPIDKETLICKRITHTEGEEVGGELFGGEKFVVPKNQVWVEGDNKNHSYDSRAHGPIDKVLVQGVVLFKIYPSFQWM